ncbi:MAG: hypothetical protein IH991_09375 [Planctomycetes bacterium]|nr:hypothetical protein [Planctomycetota bacterium]
MKNRDGRIRAILSEADKNLLDLIAECAKAGDLAGVDAVRMVAGRLRSVSESFTNGVTSGQPVEPNTAIESSRKSKKGGKRTKLPRFEVRNATLYRIGWSKKKNEQYEHKVPRDTVNDVVDAMISLGQSGTGPFTVEQIIQQADQKSSVSVPNYQVYVVIGWLRTHELIEQVGRAGYQMPSNLDGEVEALWKSSSTPKR